MDISLALKILFNEFMKTLSKNPTFKYTEILMQIFMSLKKESTQHYIKIKRN